MEMLIQGDRRLRPFAGGVREWQYAEIRMRAARIAQAHGKCGRHGGRISFDADSIVYRAEPARLTHLSHYPLAT